MAKEMSGGQMRQKGKVRAVRSLMVEAAVMDTGAGILNQPQSSFQPTGEQPNTWEEADLA